MNAMDKMDNEELISALADGQLAGEDFARGVQAATADAQARATWCAYQVVGEVLRTGRTGAATSPSEVFLARLQERLQAEQAPTLALAVTASRERAPAANDWLWKLAAGVASVAAVGAVGWNLWGSGAAGVQPQLAAGPGTGAVVEASATPMMRDARLDKLLAAHRQFGSASALGSTSGLLRNATFEGPSR